jgi:hypothetical protein
MFLGELCMFETAETHFFIAFFFILSMISPFFAGSPYFCHAFLSLFQADHPAPTSRNGTNFCAPVSRT